MLAAAPPGVVDRFGLAGQALGDVGAGAVLTHPRAFNLARPAGSTRA
jgi:acetyl-CoA C-acetyltransferase